jgi:hypothetical protein
MPPGPYGTMTLTGLLGHCPLSVAMAGFAIAASMRAKAHN